MCPNSAQIFRRFPAAKLVKYQVSLLCTIFRLSTLFMQKTLIENVNSTFDIKTGI